MPTMDKGRTMNKNITRETLASAAVPPLSLLGSGVARAAPVLKPTPFPEVGPTRWGDSVDRIVDLPDVPGPPLGTVSHTDFSRSQGYSVTPLVGSYAAGPVNSVCLRIRWRCISIRNVRVIRVSGVECGPFHATGLRSESVEPFSSGPRINKIASDPPDLHPGSLRTAFRPPRAQRIRRDGPTVGSRTPGRTSEGIES